MLGSQQARFSFVPPSSVSLGSKAVEFAARAGLHLDPWQQDVLAGSLGMNAGESGAKWAAGQVGLLVPRQNGKGAVLEARELFGMFVLKEPLIIHSAHKFDTSQEHFARMLTLIEGNPDLAKHVKAAPTANGKEAIILRNGCRLKFKARTISGGGRGFSADLLVLDEAMLLPEAALDAMLPTLRARKNPQVWFTSSAGTPDSQALWRIVKRGREQSRRLAYWEWGCPSDVDVTDRAQWASANPALGYRLTLDGLEEDFELLSEDGFAREHLGIWDDQAQSGVFDAGVWEALQDSSSRIVGPVTFAVEVAEDRSWGCIAAAGTGPAAQHVEVVEYRRGTQWMVPRMVELAGVHGKTVVVQPSSPAGSLVDPLLQANVTVVKASVQEYAQACGQFFDDVVEGKVRHLGTPQLDIAVSAAKTKASSDAFVWDRRKASTDISPLPAVTLALWGHKTHGAVDVSGSVW